MAWGHYKNHLWYVKTAITVFVQVQRTRENDNRPDIRHRNALNLKLRRIYNDVRCINKPSAVFSLKFC